MPKAYSYLRFSTPEQAAGDSLRRQLELSKAYCIKNGLELDETLSDPGVSAYRGQNAATGRLAAFLEEVKSGRVKKGSYLLVESFDRLSRQQIESAFTQFMNIIQAGVVIVTLNDGMVYQKGQLSITELIISVTIMSRAHEESKTKSLRLLSAWKEKRKNAATKRLTSMCPKWLRPVGDKFEVIPERAAIVREIFEMKRQGLGKYLIRSTLNKRGTPVWDGTSKKAQHWHHSYIERILLNRAVLGEFQPYQNINGKRVAEGAPISNYFPAVIDEQLFLSVQGQKKKKAGRNSPQCKNLVSKLAFCGACGSTMYLTDKGRYRYLVCSKAASGSGCGFDSWNYASFEKLLLSSIGKGSLAALVSKSDESRLRSLQDEVEVMEGKRADAKNRSDRLYQLIEGGTGTLPPTARQRIDAYEIQVSEATSRLERLRAEIEDERAFLHSAKHDASHIDELSKAVAGGTAGVETREKLRRELERRIDKVTIYPGGLPKEHPVGRTVLDMVEFSNDEVWTEGDGRPVPLTVLEQKSFIVVLRNHTQLVVVKQDEDFPPLVIPIVE